MKVFGILLTILLFVLAMGMYDMYRLRAETENFTSPSPAPSEPSEVTNTNATSGSPTDAISGSPTDATSGSATEASSGSNSRGSATPGSPSTCPTNAILNPDKSITVAPGGTNYPSISAFLRAMQVGACAPPQIEVYDGPISGLIGGQGNGNPSPSQISGQAADRSVMRTVMMEQIPGEQTSALTPINRLDDYEYSRIFELENAPRNSKLSKQQKNALTNQYVLDWSALPFNSEARASAEDAFVAARLEDGFREPKTGVFFKTVEGFEVAPPDHEAFEAREQKVMTGYKPTEVTKHVVDDEMERVAKVVAQTYSTDPNWEPVVEKTGEHQYAVTELRPRPKKETWASEGAMSVEEAKAAGLVTGQSLNPHVTIQDSANSGDPFFDKGGVVDYTNNRFWRYQDFNKWTPGLERMFAPTNETKAWF